MEIGVHFNRGMKVILGFTPFLESNHASIGFII